LKLSPNNPNICFNIGISENVLEDYTAAINAFNSAISVNPKFELAFLYRGTAEEGLKDYKKATEDLNQCIALNPKNSDGYLNRGAIEIDENDTSDACIDFHKALDLGNSRASEILAHYCK
jgi:tetratricopeptide (TPR) repeat protein